MGPAASRCSYGARPTWLPPCGEIIAERYLLGDMLGAGGMGAVLGGVDVKLAQQVAIKFLNPSLAHDHEQITRFMQEAQATSRVRTEHVVRVLDVGSTDEGLHYIVMERLDGADLGDHVAGGPMPVQLAVDCILQAAEALSEAHAAGVVHRDIKPSNLWLTQRPDGSPVLKVLDFGLSKLAPLTGAADPKLTETQAVFGSPAYMSPEQIRSAKNVDAATDVWALGVVLHELLTARLPFEGESVAAVLASVSADAPAPLLGVRPHAPPDLASAILACLEKDRARRISLKDLATRLRPHASLVGALSADRVVCAGPPVSSLVPPSGLPSAAARAAACAETDTALVTTPFAPAKTARRNAMGFAGAVVIVTLLAVGALWGTRYEPSPRGSNAERSPTAPTEPLPSLRADPHAPPQTASGDLALQLAPPGTASAPASASAPQSSRRGHPTSATTLPRSARTSATASAPSVPSTVSETRQ